MKQQTITQMICKKMPVQEEKEREEKSSESESLRNGGSFWSLVVSYCREWIISKIMRLRTSRRQEQDSPVEAVSEVPRRRLEQEAVPEVPQKAALASDESSPSGRGLDTS